MKKVLLLTAVAAFVTFTSCKKEREAVTDATENVVDGATDAAGDAVDAVGDAAEATGDAVVDGANAVGDAAKGVWETVSEGTKKAWEEAKAAVTDAPDFEDDGLQKWANDLHAQAVKAKAASIAGDMDDLKAATAEITSLNEGLSAFQESPEFDQATAYYKLVEEKLK